MKLRANNNLHPKTTRCRQLLVFLLALSVLFSTSCGMFSAESQDGHEEEEEAIARTEFTKRIENFFEYAPLKAGKPSQFLIHLTDLEDGTPVEKADVRLKISRKGSQDFNEIKAKVGRVTGIYVADVQIAEKGNYNIEFYVKNDKMNEKMSLENFEVE